MLVSAIYFIKDISLTSSCRSPRHSRIPEAEEAVQRCLAISQFWSDDWPVFPPDGLGSDGDNLFSADEHLCHGYQSADWLSSLDFVGRYPLQLQPSRVHAFRLVQAVPEGLDLDQSEPIHASRRLLPFLRLLGNVRGVWYILPQAVLAVGPSCWLPRPF